VIKTRIIYFTNDSDDLTKWNLDIRDTKDNPDFDCSGGKISIWDEEIIIDCSHFKRNCCELQFRSQFFIMFKPSTASQPTLINHLNPEANQDMKEIDSKSPKHWSNTKTKNPWPDLQCTALDSFGIPTNCLRPYSPHNM
jgi:hypothetical protein